MKRLLSILILISMLIPAGLLFAEDAQIEVPRAEAPVTAPAPLKVDTGDTAWVLISAALVMLMTPGLALFCGMVRRKKCSRHNHAELHSPWRDDNTLGALRVQPFIRA